MADRKLESGPQSPIAPKIDREMLKRWKAGMDEMNRIDLEERRKASYSQRLASMAAIWRQAEFLGLLLPKPLDLSVNDTWQLLRLRYRNRHG